LPGKAIAIGTLLTAGLLSNKKKKDPTFGEAFKKARKEKGPMSTFTYKGKKYSTVTKEQVQKAGHSTLRSYLNAGGKKKKTGLTTKRRKTGGPPLRRRR
jgi:FtsZ-interacting cell division protein ZipA